MVAAIGGAQASAFWLQPDERHGRRHGSPAAVEAARTVIAGRTAQLAAQQFR
jgi:hypothetical protein